MALFESYERREPQILAVLKEYGISSIEECKDITMAAGIDVMLDDRDERPGVKFNDAELIGIPYRITVGKKANEGIVEFKGRTDEKSQEISIEELLNKVIAQ